MMRLILPVDHDGDVFGDGRRNSDILLDDEDRHVAFLAKTNEHFLDLRHDHRRQALGRLVHDQEARVGHQRARDGQHLLLAAGELSAAVVFPFGEARERVIDALDRPRAGLARRGHSQVFVDGERAPEPATLRDVADAVPRDSRRGKAQHLFAAHADRAARRAREPHDRLAEGRLAHAVAPDDRQHAVSQRQIDALQRMRAAIIDVKAP